jgi:hypothetical protein
MEATTARGLPRRDRNTNGDRRRDRDRHGYVRRYVRVRENVGRGALLVRRLIQSRGRTPRPTAPLRLLLS